MITRREFGKLTLGTLAVPLGRPEGLRYAALAGAVPLGRAEGLRDAALAGADSVVGGVRLGVQTYSFRELPRTPGAPNAVDVVIKAMKDCGLTECELFAAQIEPTFNSGPRGARGASPSPEAIKAREDLRKWRLDTPLDYFRDVGRQFKSAGITVYALNYSPNASYTEPEINRGFEMARAMGAEILTASTTLEVAKKIAPIAEKHQMVMAMHGHSNLTDPNEFATPDSFAAAMKMSKYFKVNLDIGHFTAANFDAIAYLKQHHGSVTNLHLKDRKKNQGDNTPWGQGDTPIREVLQLLKKEKWPIRAYIEYEYRGDSPIDEVKKCYDYAKRALA